MERDGYSAAVSVMVAVWIRVGAMVVAVERWCDGRQWSVIAVTSVKRGCVGWSCSVIISLCYGCRE